MYPVAANDNPTESRWLCYPATLVTLEKHYLTGWLAGG